MGTPNRGYGEIGNLSEWEASRLSMQNNADEGKTVEERRKRGQFSTPFPLAREIASFGLGLLDSESIAFLEPSFGTGSLYSALLRETKGTSYRVHSATGVELDKTYFECAQDLWKDTGLRLIHADFTRFPPDGRYNFVLANPPYVRHQYLSKHEKEFLSDLVRKETEIQLSGLSGLYCYFLLLTHKWLSPNAVCGWLIPSEFMDVNYGAAVKDYLLNKVRLLKIHRYNPAVARFPDALVSSCVVWFKNETIREDYEVEFSYDGSPKKAVKKSVLLDEPKWTRFPQKSVRNIESKTGVLGDYFTIKRGLATGDNDFFILSQDRILELGMDMSFFRPILPSPRCLKTDFVNADDAGTPNLEKRFFLLDCQLPEYEIQEKYPAIWSYLQTGIGATSEKYLCAKRRKWYWQERRESTYFLCSYMGRGTETTAPIRFILNLSEAVVTNSYLMLYPKKNLQRVISENAEVLFDIWTALRNIDRSEIEEAGRVYGGGLKKIEPRELAKVRCPSLRKLLAERGAPE